MRGSVVLLEYYLPRYSLNKREDMLVDNFILISNIVHVSSNLNKLGFSVDADGSPDMNALLVPDSCHTVRRCLSSGPQTSIVSLDGEGRLVGENNLTPLLLRPSNLFSSKCKPCHFIVVT